MGTIAHNTIIGTDLHASKEAPNLFPDGGLQDWNSGASAQPDYLTDEGTPTVARDTGERDNWNATPYSVKYTATGAGNEGGSYTFSNLKASTKYGVHVIAKATAGDTARMLTTGADTNIDTETVLTAWTSLYGTFETNSTLDNVILKLVAKADGDIVWFCKIMIVEGDVIPTFAPQPGILSSTTDLRINSLGVGVAASGVTGNITGDNLIISDAGYIGSASDTDAIQIEADGDVVLTQKLGVGVTPTRKVHIVDAYTGTGTYVTQKNQLTYTANASAATVAQALNNETIFNCQANDVTNGPMSLHNAVTLQGSGSIETVRSIQDVITIANGQNLDVTTLYGKRIALEHSGGGTIGTFYGLSIERSAGAGTVTDCYGVRVTSDFKNYLGGAVDIDGLLTLGDNIVNVNILSNDTTNAITIATIGTNIAANTSLLLHLNGADGATTTTDDSNSNHTITFLDNAELDTAEKKFGSASVLLDGTDDALQVTGTISDFVFGAGDWTIDGQFYLDEAMGTSKRRLFGKGGGQADWSSDGHEFFADVDDVTEKLRFMWKIDATHNDLTASDAAIDIDAGWHHIEFVNDTTNNRFRMFLDGTEINSVGAKAAITIVEATAGTQRFLVGSIASNPGDNKEWKGWIDEFHVLKGTALHAANFTAPTAEYPGKVLTADRTLSIDVNDDDRILTLGANLTISAAVVLDVAVGGIGIVDDDLVQMDDADAAANDYCRLTANGIEGRDYSEVLADLSAEATAAFDWNGQDLTNAGVLFLTEQAAAEADVAGKGQIWVKTATPNELWFTDDAGGDHQIAFV